MSSLSPGFRNRGNFFLWKRESWALESRIPLTIESGILVPLTKNPEFRTWNPEFWVQGVEPRIHDCLGFPSSLFGNKIISVESIVGLHVAAHDLDIPWIIIKGISEYKDGRNPVQIAGKSSWVQWPPLSPFIFSVIRWFFETGPTILRQVSTTTNYPRLEYVTCFYPLNLSVQKQVE